MYIYIYMHTFTKTNDETFSKYVFFLVTFTLHVMYRYRNSAKWNKIK